MVRRTLSKDVSLNKGGTYFMKYYIDKSERMSSTVEYPKGKTNIRQK